MVACISSSFLSTAGFTVCTDQFVHSLVDRQLGCVQFPMMTNPVGRCIWVCIFVEQTLSFLLGNSSSGMARSYGNCMFNFIRNCCVVCSDAIGLDSQGLELPHELDTRDF